MLRTLAFLALSLHAVAADIVLQDITLIDGTGHPPVAHATVVIRDGRIVTAASPNARIIRLSGKTVMPALINAHGHLGLTQGPSSGPQVYSAANIERQLIQYQRYGVTRMLSLGLNHDLVYDLRKSEPSGATIMTADRGFGAFHGVPPSTMSDIVYRPRTPDEARQEVRETASRKPDFIKLWLDDSLGTQPKMPPVIYGAIIDEAHRQGLKVAAHVFYLDDAKQLVRDGVDVLAHSVRDKPVDDEFIGLMKHHGTFYIPTLQLEEAFFIYSEKPPWMDSAFFRLGVTPDLGAFLVRQANTQHRQFLATAEQNLKRLADAGISIAFGTDSGATPTRIQGFAEHRELYLMVSSGLTPLQAIHSATAVNARMLGVAERTGTIEQGKDADLLVLDGDPSADISATTHIAAVFQRGIEVVPLHESSGIHWQ
jgi:imidazolonepropionase-like amidohydrolase